VCDIIAELSNRTFSCNGIALRLNKFPIAVQVLDVDKLRIILSSRLLWRDGGWGGVGQNLSWKAVRDLKPSG
jgi:hypothetical protein